MNRPPPPDVRAAALELARNLRAMADSPKAQAVLRGLERALPEAAAEVRAAMADPLATATQIGTRMAADAIGELAAADNAIARGLGAFIRGATREAGADKRTQRPRRKPSPR